MQPECKNIDLPTCGICSTKLNFNLLLEKKVQEHPHLKILICQNCFENFNMTDNDILCAWCKISEETTVKCIKCSAAFCKKCLEQNFDEDKLKVILRKKQWLCFTCDPVPLRKRRDSCKKVLNWLSKTEFPSKNVNKKFHNNKSINNIDESLPEIRKALIEKCSQLSEIGFQLITRSNSHMTVFKLQDINLPNILEALNYESQLMLSVAELCKIFIAEIDTMKEQLENLNEDVSQEPEVISGTSNALSYGKKDNKTRKRKRQNKLSLLANTAMTSEASDTEENMDIDEEQQLSKPEVLSNGTAKLNKSDNGDSNSGKLSLFSQETVDLNMHKEALDCSDEKVASYNSEPPTDGELLLNGKSNVIINEGSEKSPASATLLPNATEASIIQDEKSSSVDDIGKNSISEERQDTTANNCSDDKLRYDQETEEDDLTPDSPDASKTSKTNFLFALGLCSTKEIDDRYVEMFKQYDDVDTSESDEEVNEMLSEKSSAYSTPDELRDVGHISRSLPNLPSDDEQNDLHTENSEATKNLSFPPCQIVLNKLDNTIASYLNEYNADQDESSQLSDDQENQEVDRLANLNSIGVNGKKRTHSTEEVVKSGLKKSKVNNKDSDSDSTMSLSHLLDDNNENNKTDLPLDEHNSEMDVVEYDCIEPMEVQEQISPPVSDSDFDSDLIKDSDEENESKSKKTRKLKECENKENENKENEPLKEEVDVKPIKAAKPKWRNDPLLKGRITEDTDSDDDKSVNSKDQVRKKRKHEHPIENHNIHATSSKESASEEEYVSNLIFLSSDSDSSIEFIKEFKNKNSKRPPISLNFSTDDESDSEEEVSLSMSKGRKNIRSICSDAELSILTKKAMDAEKSRRERVNEKQKLMTKVTNTKSLVLDVDEVTATPTITVHPTLYKRLKDHQRHGVQFMYNCCYENVNNGKKNEGTGCILAHSMGLGKTYQVVTLIHTLFAHEATNTKRVLIVCPLSVVFNWKDEFREAFKSVNDDKTINVFYISDKCDLHKRIEMIKKWRRKTGILIMGYEAYQKLSLPKEKTFDAQVSKLIRNALVNPGPDLVILDEGHLLKNGKIARTRALMEIKTKRRIILTGTPLQNNLKEYYYMVNFVKPNYLGSLKEYSNRFMNPITNGQYHDSTERDIKQMKKRSHILNKLLNVYVIQRYGIAELEKYLPKRHDHVLFIELHSVQIQMYTKYIANLENSVMEKNNLFNNFHFLQFICSHPINLLMKEKASIKANLKSNRPTTDSPYLKDVTGLPPNWWNSICPDDYKSNLDYGPKYKVMMAIIRECEAIGDKVLIFSNSMIDLEAIEYFLQQNSTSTSEWKRDLDYFRMDGSVSQSKRAEMCHFFNNPENKRIRLFLLSYRVACLGINLKAANRVILMNVSWNPAIDSQSIFRMYRFGQVKECFVYRLVAMGAMEEVLYERQITKLAVARRVIDETQVSRHYSSTDLQVMYRFNFQTNQPRPMLHISKDAILMKIIEKFPGCVFKYHEHQSLLEDRPDEVLNADDMKSAWEEYYREDEEKTTEQQKKQLKNAPVAGPSGIPNLPSAKVTDQQLKGAPVGGSINAVNNMSTSTPVIRPLNPPTMNNNGPIVNSLQVPNLRPDLNRTLFNNYSMNANNIRANHSYPKGKINPTSFTKTLASQFNNNSSSNINPFSINRQVSNARTINSNVINCDEQNTQSKKPVVLQTLARAIHNRNMQQNAARLEKYPVQPIKISVNQVILSKQEEQHRILSSMHGNSEITISAIGDPRPSTPNTNSNGDSVIQID